MVAHFTRDADFLGLVGAVDGDLVVGAVTLLDAEVVIQQVDVEIGQDQLLLDEVPDDPGHLVAVHLDDGVGHLDLGHGSALSVRGILWRPFSGKAAAWEGWYAIVYRKLTYDAGSGSRQVQTA
jgi:hypothetical protein